jgi:hypothetical protein
VQHAKGYFDITTEKGTYLIQVQAKDHKPGNPAPSRATTTGWYRQTFGLLQGGRSGIKGTVVGRKGRPIRGATVIALITGASRWGWRMLSMGGNKPSSARVASTNAEGNFAITDLPAGTFGLYINFPGYLAWKQRGIALADGEHKELGTIKLDGRTGTIKGTIFGPDTQPKSGVMVMAITNTQKGPSFKFTRSGASGQYELADVAAGRVRVIARMGRGMIAPRRMVRINLKAGETKIKNFAFGQGGITLTGTLTDVDGTPVKDAKVSALARIGKKDPTLSSGSTTTNERGEYSISGLKQGIHTVTIERNKQLSPGGEVNVKGSETTHHIRLQGGKLTLSFVDKLTKKAPSVPIWSMLYWKQTNTQRLVQKSDPGKSTTFRNLPDKDMNLRIFTQGYATLIKTGVRPGVDNKTKTLRIELTPAGKLHLTLHTDNKQQPEQVYVQLFIAGKYQWVPCSQTAGGTWLVSSLPPGAGQFKINAKSYKPLEVNINIPTKEAAKATFSLTSAPEKK